MEATVAKWRAITSIARTLIISGAVPCTFLAITPVANALAGKETAVNITVALTAALALTVTTGGAGAWGYQQKKRADDARKRVEQLESKLMSMSDQVESLERRNELLERGGGVEQHQGRPRGGKSGR